MSRKAKGSIFAVHCDFEGDAEVASKSASNNMPLKRKAGLSGLSNKENGPTSTLSSVPVKKSTAFNGKVPFDLASPVSNLADQLSQTLGFFAASPIAPMNRRLQNKRINSRSEEGGNKGDPIKASSSSFAKQPRLGKGLLETVDVRQCKEAWRSLSEQSSTPPQSPVLANVTEAYNGNGGFHFSPMVCHSIHTLP